MRNRLCYCLGEQCTADPFSLHASIDVKAEQLGDSSLKPLDCEASDKFSIDLCYQFDLIGCIGAANCANGSIQAGEICDQTERRE